MLVFLAVFRAIRKHTGVHFLREKYVVCTYFPVNGSMQVVKVVSSRV